MGDLFLSAVALAYSTTPHSATRYTHFFLIHERKAVLPVQRYLDNPCLDMQSKQRLSRLQQAHVHVYEKHAVHANECSEWLKKSNKFLLVGTTTAVKLNPQDKADLSNEFGPLCGPYMGP